MIAGPQDPPRGLHPPAVGVSEPRRDHAGETLDAGRALVQRIRDPSHPAERGREDLVPADHTELDPAELGAYVLVARRERAVALPQVNDRIGRYPEREHAVDEPR